MVCKVYGVAAGQPVREWVMSNCSFAFVEIPDGDLCAAVEAVMIVLLRKTGCKLLNAREKKEKVSIPLMRNRQADGQISRIHEVISNPEDKKRPCDVLTNYSFF